MISFFAGAIPSNQTQAINMCLNWALENGFEVLAAFNVLLPAVASPIASPGGAGPMISMVYIFLGADEPDFLDYFGVPYSEEISKDIPKMINDIEIKRRAG